VKLTSEKGLSVHQCVGVKGRVKKDFQFYFTNCIVGISTIRICSFYNLKKLHIKQKIASDDENVEK
jgi:hypothetical protein